MTVDEVHYPFAYIFQGQRPRQRSLTLLFTFAEVNNLSKGQRPLL